MRKPCTIIITIQMVLSNKLHRAVENQVLWKYRHKCCIH